MNPDTLASEMQALAEEHGPWTAHNIGLPGGLYTLGPEPNGNNHRALKFVQLASDILRRPLSELRVLDLACLEGLYGIEFAQHGSEVVGIEGRAAGVAKCRFAANSLGLEKATFRQGDVREVSLETDGAFDVIICSGILYHLDKPALFHFLKALQRMCRGACFIDTHVALVPDRRTTFEGRGYCGRLFAEHRPGTDAATKLASSWASLDNEQSFWPTKAGLVNFLGDIGFSSVLDVMWPAQPQYVEDRITLVAIAGSSMASLNPSPGPLAPSRWPDGPGT